MASETITTTSAPWSAQQPFLQNLFNRANTLYASGGPQYFSGSTVAPLSSMTQGGIDAMYNRGMQGSPVNQAAQNQVMQTAQGDFLGGNQFLDGMYDRAASAVTRNFREAQVPGMNAVFASSGRTGSGLHANAYDMQQDNLGRSLEGLASNLYGMDYANERQRMLQASALAPSLAEQDFRDSQAMLQAGSIQDGQNQAMLSDEVNRFNFNQMRPFDNLNRYASYIGGSYGQQGSQTSPLYENRAGQGVGGALAGYGLGSSLFPGGIGGIGGGTLGAIGGGLLGLFG